MNLRSGFSILMLLWIHIVSYGQTGPGGIGTTSGNSNLILWLNAEAITNVYNQNNITTWTDASGYGNNATQSSSSNKPNFRTNFINGFSAVSFNGTTEYLDGALGIVQAPLSVFTAGYYNQLNQGANDSDYLFSIGNTSIASYNRLSTARARSNDTGNADKYFNATTDATYAYGDVITGQQWVITSQMYSSSNPYLTAYLNGAAMTLSGSYAGAFINEGNYSIGRYRNAGSITASHLLNGNVGEVIVFNRIVNTAERNIINSYLSAKYNLAVANDKYTGDDAVNGDHDRDVVGIGKEPDGENTAAYTASMTISAKSNFDTGDYILVGHAQQSNSIITSDSNLGTLQGRWGRVWWLDISDAGLACTATMSFDFSDSGFGGAPMVATNYKLIYRSGISSTWNIIPITPSISGDVVRFEDISLSTYGDGQYTLATADITISPLGTIPLNTTCNGPGGVGTTDGSSTLELWLNAQSISGSTSDPVLIWPDLSGNKYDATATPDNGSYPTLLASATNNQNAVSFSVNHYFSGSIQNLDAPATIIAVPYFDQLNQSNIDYVFRIGQTGTSNAHTSIVRRGAPDQDKYSSWDGAANRLGVILAGQAWTVLTQYLNSTSTLHDLYINGARNTPTNFTGAINTNGVYEIGRFEGNQHFLLGKVAEIITYSKVLNAAELAIIHSYLSAKYNISISNDKYAGDTDANGNYDLDVAGIGQSASDGGSALAGSNNSACSAGLSLSIASNFQDGDFLLVGHKVISNSLNTTDINSSPTGIQARWDRVWYLDVTDAGAAANVNFVFDFSSAGFNAAFASGDVSNYKLLYRSAESGTWSTLASGSTYDADQLTFLNISITNDGYYALGSIDILTSPLPIELVGFEVQPKGDQILLFWTTASESNFDRFEIERSSNGLDFITIGKVPGNNHPSGGRYQFLDTEFVGEKAYYRLKMIDSDNTTKYSDVKLARLNNNKLMVFPNPAKDSVTILKASGEKNYVTILDYRGVKVDSFELSEDILKYVYEIDQLSTGIYTMVITYSGGREISRIIKVP